MASKVAAPKKALANFEEAEGLGSNDKEFIRDLVAVLERHGNLDRFGLCLLHDHFQLAQDEILVETNDSQERTLRASVEKIEESNHAKASQWRFLPNVASSRRSEFEGGQYEVLMKCEIKCD